MIGVVTYKLELLEKSLEHLVFHVSMLKNKVREAVVVSSILPVMYEGGRVRICLVVEIL
jgi:hypothetical protein